MFSCSWVEVVKGLISDGRVSRLSTVYSLLFMYRRSETKRAANPEDLACLNIGPRIRRLSAISFGQSCVIKILLSLDNLFFSSP